MSSGPLEAGEDGVSVRDSASIVKDKPIAGGVVVGYVDDLGPA